MALGLKKKTFAKESHKTKKVREKLKRKLEQFEQAITEQALEQKTIEIHRWIARQAPYRVVLRSKNISLFDENQNTAKMSRRIEGLIAKVSEQNASETTSLKERKVEKR